MNEIAHSPDIGAAMGFLRSWIPGGPWSLGAIDPDDRQGLAWITTESEVEAERFLVEQSALRRGIYYQPNVCRDDLGPRRAKKEHVAVALCLHADVDPPAVASAAELAAWQVTTMERLADGEHWRASELPAPTAIVFSGSGFQLLWRLAEPVLLWSDTNGSTEQDPALVDSVEGRCYSIIRRVDPSHVGTHNVDRLLRLPGTLNWPNEKKRANGRTIPELAAVEWIGNDHTLEAFPYEQPPESAEAAPRSEGAAALAREGRVAPAALAAALPPWLHEAVVEGPEKGADRSKAAFAAICGLIRCVDDDTIEAILGDPAFAVSGHFLDQADVERAIGRAIDAAHLEVDVKIAQGRRLLEAMQRELARRAPVLAVPVTPPPAPSPPPLVLELEVAPPNPLAFVLPSPSEPASTGAPSIPTTIEFEAALRSVQRRLSRRVDPDAIQDAELLKRVLEGEFLTAATDAEDDRQGTLARAVLAVARAAPPGATSDQIHRQLLASSGALACDLPEVIQEALVVAIELGPIGLPVRKESATLAARASDPDDFDIELSGPRAGRPASANQRNVRLALRKLGVELRYNDFARQEEIVRGGRVDVVEDPHVKALRAEMESAHDFRPGKDDLFDMCEVIARENAYHPIRDYLASLPEDAPAGSPAKLTERWLIDCAGAEDTPYVRAVSRLVLVAAVRRVRHPGCKFDEMLVLETPIQGKDKSKALAALAVRDEWFTDDFNFKNVDDTKKMMETTTGRWIVEAGELKGMNEGRYNDLKAYLSRRKDAARAAYGRKTTTVFREFIIIGTTNEQKYLLDPTGNRRIWPVRVVRFDVLALLAMRDQLWAEASRLELEHPEPEYIRLDPELYAAAAEQQAAREVDDPIRERLDRVLADITGRIRVEDAWKIVGYEDEIPNRRDSMAISSAMQSLGFAQRRITQAGDRGTWYRRGATEEERDQILGLTGGAAAGWRVGPKAGVYGARRSGPLSGPDRRAN